MIKNFGISSLFHKALPATRAEQEQATQASAEKLTRELAAAELDTRFREALAIGEIAGDIVAVDEQGHEVERKRSNIFDS